MVMKEIQVLIDVLKLIEVKKSNERSLYNKEMARLHIGNRRAKKIEDNNTLVAIKNLRREYNIPSNPKATSNDIRIFITMVLETGNSGTKVLKQFQEANNKTKDWKKHIAKQRAGNLFKNELAQFQEHSAIVRIKANKMYNEKDILNSTITGALRKLSKQLALSNDKDADINKCTILKDLLAVKNDTSSATKVNWIEVQTNRDKGITTRELANIFNISASAVSKYTHKLNLQ